MQAVPDTPGPEAPFKEYVNSPIFPLPEAAFPRTTLEDALLTRLSCRRFTGAPLEIQQLATVLKASYGIQRKLFVGDLEFLERPVPSAGGLYPLELYVLAHHVLEIDPGVYHYSVPQHALEQIRSLQLPAHFISDLFMGQPYVAEAAVTIMVTAVIERSLWKYGDRGYRYLFLDAGHMAQNLNLVSSAMGLASLNLGGFFDSHVANLLDTDIEREVPLYGVAVGVPSGDDRAELRRPT